ncbi:MAG: LytTR family DNA-binding domain-containing protein [Oscillospiraceae bacterium]
MIKIAICDDESLFIQQCSDAILQYYPTGVQLCSFGSAKEIQGEINAGLNDVDIIFMDIELQNYSGIDIAVEINQSHKNIKFIFITGFNAKYSEAIFLNEMNLVGYVAKPFNAEILKANIHKAITMVQKEKSQVFAIKYNSTVHQINYNDVYYIESYKHKIKIYTDKEEHIIGGRLDATEEALPNNFIRVHQSFIVNMDKIYLFNKTSVTLTNKAEIPISKAKYKQARTAYFTYKGLML